MKKISFIQSLTPLRGIAAIMVAVLHFSDDLFPKLDTISYTFLIQKGYLWVDFFFILSGFIITHVYGHLFKYGCKLRDYQRFMFARFTKIYPVHFFVLLAFIIIEFVKLWFSINTQEVLLTEPFSGDRHPFGIFTTILLIHSLGVHQTIVWNFPSWSMSVEWATYLIYPLLAYLLLRIRQFHAELVLLLIFLTLVFFTYLHGHLNVYHDYGIVRCALEFSIGMIAYRIYEEKRLINLLRKSQVFFVALIFTLTFMHFGWFDALTIPFFFIIILAAAHNKTTVYKILNIRPLIILGDISFSLYMTHFFVREFGSRIYRILTGNNIWQENLTAFQSLVGLLICMIFVILVAWLCFHFVERPCQHKLKAINFSRNETRKLPSG